jgi:hypothetical protein
LLEARVLCNAAAGYDGPTGAGSISGQIATGGPGIGLPSFGAAEDKTYTRRITNTAAYLQGGVYPNGEAASYYWQYGTTTSYGSKTKALSAGSGSAAIAISSQLAQLKPGTKYHYRLVATNSSGTEYGYDVSLTTTGHAKIAEGKRTRAKHRRQAGHTLAVSSTGRRAPLHSCAGDVGAALPAITEPCRCIAGHARFAKVGSANAHSGGARALQLVHLQHRGALDQLLASDHQCA